MKKNIYFITIFLILIISCKKENEKNFNINVENFENSGELIMVSDENGELVYEADINNGVIKLDVPTNKTVDVTYGWLTSGINTMTTYRGIPSGYTLKPNKICDDYNPSIIYNEQRKFELTVEGVDQYEELYFNSFLGREVISGTNSIIIKGILASFNAEMFTILYNGSSEYKSLIVKYYDWIINGSTARLTVHINDFQELEKIEVDYGLNGKLRCFAYAHDNTDDYITMSGYFTHDIDYGSTLKLFKPENIDRYRLHFYHDYDSIKHSVIETRNYLPESISFYQPLISIIDKDKTSYNISNIEDAELVRVEITYKSTDNKYLFWRIWQLGGTSFSYNLPSLPNQYSSGDDNYAELFLQNPESINITVYTGFNQNIEELYITEKPEFTCLEYKTKGLREIY